MQMPLPTITVNLIKIVGGNESIPSELHNKSWGGVESGRALPTNIDLPQRAQPKNSVNGSSLRGKMV